MPAQVFEEESARVPVAPEATPPSLPPDESVTHRCANCLTPLAGPFCAQCGQHVADYHRSVWRFVADFFDNAFCWDNKLFRTLDPLLKRPGFLTQEFMAGRRVRYVHPLRLFLFTSAICLTLLQYTHRSGTDRERGRKPTDHRPATSVRHDADDGDEKSKPTASVAPALAGSPASSSPTPAASASPPKRWDRSSATRSNPMRRGDYRPANSTKIGKGSATTSSGKSTPPAVRRLSAKK